MTTQPLLKVENVTYSYPGNEEKPPVLQQATVRLMAGQVAAIVGPSGCGKSTLLHIASGLLPITQGTVHYENLAVHELGAEERAKARLDNTSLIMQSYNLIQHDTVFNNVSIPLRYGTRRDTRAGIEQRVHKVLGQVGLSEYTHKKVKKLSGGEKQRVAIARALVPRPKLVIADEPTAALDAANLENVCSLLRQLADDGSAVLLATHDPRVVQLCDWSANMANGVLSDPNAAQAT